MTISSVAPTTLPAGTSDATTAGPSGLGALFAGLLGAKSGSGSVLPGPNGDPASSDSATTEPVLTDPAVLELPETSTEPDAATPAEILAAAQVMAAAQVVPLTPVMAAAVSLSAGVGLAGPPFAAPVATEQAATSGQGTTAEPPAEPSREQGGTSAGSNVAQDGPTADATAPTGAAMPQDARPEHGGAGRQQSETAPVTAAGGQPATAPTTATPSRHEAVPASQVTGQVFPEVGRLVSRGDGTRRITLKLSPEALGDVRVVLTVRDGDVQVRMIGSEQAQQALRAGAPELQRLLDLAGATSSQIIVGDQGRAPDAGQPGAADRHPGDQPGDHRTAGTRDGDTSARDGSSRGPQQRPSTDPSATRGDFTRTGPGVDVTM